MNKRQEEKHFKRKWQTALSGLFAKECGIYIKPSRMKLRVVKDGDKYRFEGRGGGYAFKLDGIAL